MRLKGALGSPGQYSVRASTACREVMCQGIYKEILADGPYAWGLMHVDGMGMVGMESWCDLTAHLIRMSYGFIPVRVYGMSRPKLQASIAAMQLACTVSQAWGAIHDQ